MLVLDLAGQGHDHVLDGRVERAGVVDPVIEPLALAVGEVDVAGKPSLAGNLDTQGQHLVEQAVERILVLKPSLGRELERGLADRAIGLLQERGHLGERSLLPLEVHRHGPHHLLVLLLELGQAGLAGDVGFPEQGPAVLQGAVEDGVAVGGQLAAERGIQVAIAHVVLNRLELGLDVADEAQVGGLALRVIGLAGHRHVAFDSLLAHGRVQLAGGLQPPLEIAGRGDRHRQELLIPRLDLLPGLQLDLLGKPLVGKRLGNVIQDGHRSRLSGTWKSTRSGDDPLARPVASRRVRSR